MFYKKTYPLYCPRNTFQLMNKLLLQYSNLQAVQRLPEKLYEIYYLYCVHHFLKWFTQVLRVLDPQTEKKFYQNTAGRTNWNTWKLEPSRIEYWIDILFILKFILLALIFIIPLNDCNIIKTYYYNLIILILLITLLITLILYYMTILLLITYN